MVRKALQEAIDAIDTLIERLNRGELSAAGAPVQAPAPVQPQPAAAPAKPTAAAPAKPAAAPAKPAEAKAKGKKEKQPAAAKPAAGTSRDAAEELFSKAHLAVAKIVSVEGHPNSDKLYLIKIDVGGGQERQVVAGLRKHVPEAELAGSHVVVVLNLKAAKLAGVSSEAMILAASTQEADGAELVRVLRPAEGAEAGEPVFLEGGAPSAEYQKTLKSWSKIVEQLAVKGGKPCYAGRPLVSAAGPAAVAADMPEGAEIH